MKQSQPASAEKDGILASAIGVVALMWDRLSGRQDRYYQGLLREREATIIDREAVTREREGAVRKFEMELEKLEKELSKWKRGDVNVVRLDKAVEPTGPLAASMTAGEGSSGESSAPLVQSWYRPGPEPWVPEAFETKTLDASATMAGELSGFVAGFKGDERLRNGDCVGYRITLDTDTIWDPDFATIIAAMVSVDNEEAVSQVWLGLGDDEGIAYEEQCRLSADDWLESGGLDWFGSGGWRFAQRPSNPFLQIRIVLRATPAAVRVKVTRLFAGQDFDPYLFNPHYEQAAEYCGWPKIANEEQVLNDFEDKAREACRTDSYLASQAFVRPFLVMREGEPRFPMLIGSVASLTWYGIEPPHRLELYRELGCIGEGEVTLDCGAHAGQLAAYFALASGPQGRVIAIDPFAHNCLQVEAQAALNAPGRIRAVKAGVGAKRQTLRVSILGQMTTVADGRTSQDDTDIEIVPLDDYLDEKPTFIKLDVEGAEVDALIGAARLLCACKPKIFIDVHTQLLGQFGYTLTDLFSKIPLDLYDIKFMVKGVDSAWRLYQPGLEAGVTTPLLVYAAPKAETHPVRHT